MLWCSRSLALSSSLHSGAVCLAMCRQIKSVANGSTSLDHRPRLPDAESEESSYQSPASLPSSTSDADTRSPDTWHMPPGSPRHENPVDVDERLIEDHLGDAGLTAVASSNDDVVDEPSSSVWIPRELTSSDVTATATELRTDTSLHSDVERGK